MQLRRDGAETPQPVQQRIRMGDGLLERQLPTPDGIGQELLRHPQRRRQCLSVIVVPAAQGRDICELPGRQEAKHLQLWVDARLELSEHLERKPLVEHDRGVRLLHAHRPGVRILGWCHDAVQAAEREPALGRVDLVAEVESPQ